jgi:tetrahydromethanopterin S-methyltransferase subunit C
MGEVKTITMVPVRPVALMGGAIEAVVGLIYGIHFWAVIAVFGIGGGIMAPEVSSLGTGVVAAVIIIIVGIIGGFVGGYILTAIAALIYNWLAPKIGGIKLELE